jgi:hypothetical protein
MGIITDFHLARPVWISFLPPRHDTIPESITHHRLYTLPAFLTFSSSSFSVGVSYDIIAWISGASSSSLYWIL